MNGLYQHIKVHFTSVSQRILLLVVVITSFSCNGPGSKTNSTARQEGAPSAKNNSHHKETTSLPRNEWGAALVKVSDSGGLWTLAGENRRVRFDASDLSVDVKAGAADWDRKPSQSDDIIVRKKGKEKKYPLSLADAGYKKVEYYDAGYKAGIKITLSDWKDFDLTLYLTICLEAGTEDLIFTVAAKEDQTLVQQLDWPTALEARGVDYTVLPNFWGILLPANWPKPFNPIRPLGKNGTIPKTDHSELQSNVIEDWSMSWWGSEKGKSAMMVIVETPDDAAYQFSHPAGGPTVIGPRWQESLGKVAYQRKLRMCFFPEGNYVDMAKRYRRYVKNTGLFVSLKEKIATSPVVKKLIGVPMMRTSILVDYKKGGYRWKHDILTRHQLVSFKRREEALKKIKADGLEHLTVILTGWGHYGYDRQHPDVIPPAPEAGGWRGLKQLVNTCKAMGYLVGFHDQYRDYYTDAPSYDPQFAIHEAFADGKPHAFPGTRFGDFKEGKIPMMNHWDGGKQSYLSGPFMPGHFKQNYRWLIDHGIRVQGSYLDVFGYVPPDEDFNPEHPVTRTDDMTDRIRCYQWARNNLGFVGTEAGCDWTIPYTDFSSPEHSKAGVAVSLMSLVYHDAILTPYKPNDLRGFLYGGIPEIRMSDLQDKKTLHHIKQMCKLNKRVALLEMTNDQFLDSQHRIERTTYSDGTTVTVNWDKNNVKITPALK
ncbi:MAG TPA: DUF5696 domain-containing protein [Chitinophagaceae bacterium]|nr:DUF5696 domain-containing protein [Chitinophagaceae bacterium]